MSEENKGRTMRAAVVSKYSPEQDFKSTIAVQSLPFPGPLGDNDVLLKIIASSINPVDFKVAVGAMTKLRDAHPPYVPGVDIAGQVVGKGSKVSQFKVGDYVFGSTGRNRYGGFAEFAVAPQSALCKKPSSLNMLETASLPVACLTSYQALFKKAQLRAGERVLILGGSGGAGHFAVQLAKKAGASPVVATCSTRNADWLKQTLGADEVVDYTSENWSETLKGREFDVVCDCVGGSDVWKQAESVMTPRGRFVTIVGDMGHEEQSQTIGLTQALKQAGSVVNRKFWSLAGYRKYDLVLVAINTAELKAMAQFIDANGIRPQITTVLPLDKVVDAFDAIKTGHTRGKICISIDPGRLYDKEPAQADWGH